MEKRLSTLMSMTELEAAALYMLEVINTTREQLREQVEREREHEQENEHCH